MGGVRVSREISYQIAWNAACRLGVFCYGELQIEAEIGDKTAPSYVKQWLRSKVVELDHIEGKRKYFKVIKPDGGLPQKFRPDGVAVRTQTIQGNLWRSMRGLPAFTPRDLAVHSTTDQCAVDEQAAQAYCQMLARAGYLRVERKAVPGRRQAIYRLIRNTGPKPPKEKRIRGVYDENLDKVTHLAGGLT